MTDPFIQHESGLSRLAEELKENFIGHSFDIFIERFQLESRLKKNIAQTQQYGNTETSRVERIQILEALNQFSLRTVHLSFNELCWTHKSDQSFIDLRAIARMLLERQPIVLTDNSPIGLDELFASDLLTVFDKIKSDPDKLKSLFDELGCCGITVTNNGTIVGSQSHSLLVGNSGKNLEVAKLLAKLHLQVCNDPSVLLAEYRASLIRTYAILDLRELRWLKKLRFPVDSICPKVQELRKQDIPFSFEVLDETREPFEEEKKRRRRRSFFDDELRFEPTLPPPLIPIEAAFRETDHLVVLGEPGSGKSTLLHYLTLRFAQKRAKNALGLRVEKLPIYVSLVDYADILDNDITCSLDNFVVKTLTDQPFALSPKLIEEELRQGRCILLLDALDKVNSRLRWKVTDQVNEFLKNSDFRRNLVVVANRISSYLTDRFPAKNIKIYMLQPFQYSDIKVFAYSWFQAVAEVQSLPDLRAEAEHQTEDFLKYLQQPYFDHLPKTPLLLQMAAVVFAFKGAPPSNPASLYSIYFDFILMQQADVRMHDSLSISPAQVRQTLSTIAWNIYRLGRLRRRQLLEIIEAESYVSDPEPVLDYIENLNLIAGFGNENYGFVYPVFQNYFLAHHFLRWWHDSPQAFWQFLCPIRHFKEIREPVLIFAGLLSIAGSDTDAVDFIQRIWHANEDKANGLGYRLESILQRDLLLAGWCLAETEPGKVRKLYSAYVNHLVKTWKQTPFSQLRDELMQILGVIGDATFKETVAKDIIDHYLRQELELNEIDPLAVNALGYLRIVDEQITVSIQNLLLKDVEREIEPELNDSGRKEFAHLPSIEATQIGKIHQAAIKAVGSLSLTSTNVIDGLVSALKLHDEIIYHTVVDVLRNLSQTDSNMIVTLIDRLSNYLEAEPCVVDLLAQIGESSPVVVDTLIDAIADETKSVSLRILTVSALGRLISRTKGHVKPKAFETLLNGLYDGDNDIREKALDSLGKSLPAKGMLTYQIRDELVFALSDSEQKIQNAAYEALCNLIALEHQTREFMAAGYSKHPLSRLFQAKSALIGGMTNIIVALLADCPPVAEARMGDLDTFSTEDDTRFSLREQAVANLTRVFLISSPQIIDKSLQRLIEAWYPDFTSFVPASLRNLDEAGKRHVLQRVIGALESLQADLPKSIVEDSIGMGEAAFSGKNFESLLYYMEKMFVYNQAKAIDSLIDEWELLRTPPEEIVEKLLLELSTNEPFVVLKRMSIIKMLGQLQEPPPQVITALIKTLGDIEFECRQAAAEALGNFRYSDPYVIKALSEIEPAFIRSLGKVAQGYDRIDEVINLLVEALRDQISGAAAAESLGHLGYVNQKIVTALIEALSNKNQKIRRTAIRSLVQLAKIDRDNVVRLLILACTNIRERPSPKVITFVQKVKSAMYERAYLYYPDFDPDIHNHAYNALRIIVESQQVA